MSNILEFFLFRINIYFEDILWILQIGQEFMESLEKGNE